jgi:preprotein translocase subunit SecF
MQFFGKTNIDFLSPRRILALSSTIIIVVSMGLAFILGPKLGIDFAGGTELAVAFTLKSGETPSGQITPTDEIRKIVNNAGLTGVEIKSFGGPNSFLIRVLETEDSDTRIIAALSQAMPNVNIETLKVDRIGPKIGSELYTEGLIALLAAVICILIYIAFRFEFVFGLGSIVALLHDVLLTFGLVVIFQHLNIINLEINQGILAGMLTVIGYSINNTVIIFDRIRENKDKHKGMNFFKMVNMSINDTLSRTINTTTTTAIVFLTILLFGGPVLQGLSFTMLIGVLVGTYSSIYISPNFVMWYLEKVKKYDLTQGLAKAETDATRLKNAKA